MSKDLAEFYEAVGMPLVEGYGLTEGGVVTLNPLDRPSPAASASRCRASKFASRKMANCWSRAPACSPATATIPPPPPKCCATAGCTPATSATSTARATSFITGRKKELIVSSTGKKIYPSHVENLFKMEPLISQVLLIGDRLPYLTALFTINNSAAENLKGMDEFKGRPAADMAQAPPVLAEVHKSVARVNKLLAPFEQVRKYRVLARDFTIEQGELTATMKVRRMRAMENFKDHIDELYAGRES